MFGRESAKLPVSVSEVCCVLRLADVRVGLRRRGAWLAVAGVLVVGMPAPGQDGPEALVLPEYAQAFHRGDYPRAIALAGDRLAVEPADVRAWIVRARAEAALGRFDVAMEGFREALRLEPRDPDALYYVGVTAGALAEMEFDRLVKLAPDSARAHQLLGESYEAQGRAAEAEAEYRAALQADPDSVDALLALGDLVRSDLALSKERLSEARDYYARAIERQPESYDALYGLGACDAVAGEHASAIGFLRRAVKVAPNSAPARLALGISLLQTGEITPAVAELETAARLEPKMRQAYVHLARAYRTLGRVHDMEQAITRFRELAQEEQEATAAQIGGQRPDPRR
jgi:tetratricopeptide (TPR) repeat protein